MKKISTVLVDYDESILEDCHNQLLLAPGIHLLGRFTDITGALRLTTRLHTDILVIGGIKMSPDGVALLREITDLHPFTKILLLLAENRKYEILPALSAGIMGILDARKHPETLAKAIETIHQGEAWLPRSIIGSLLKRIDLQAHELPVNLKNLH